MVAKTLYSVVLLLVAFTMAVLINTPHRTLTVPVVLYPQQYGERGIMQDSYDQLCLKTSIQQIHKAWCAEAAQTLNNPYRSVDYYGWPYKIKFGSTDYCFSLQSNDPMPNCLGNDIHADLREQWLIINYAITLLPAAALVAVIFYGMQKKQYIRIVKNLAIVGACLFVGWLVYSITLRVFFVQNNDITQTVRFGLPIWDQRDTLPSSCGMANDTPAAVKQCLVDSYTTIDVREYGIIDWFNWLFWSGVVYGLWRAGQKFYYKKYRKI